MKIPHCPLLWALLLLCCLPFGSAQAQKQVEVVKFPFEEPLQMASLDAHFYHLNLANPPNGLDLLITVLPVEGSSPPKLFVSRIKEFPQKTDDADYSSTSTSGNIVFYISHQDLEKYFKSLYLGLLCENPNCNAKILIEWIDERNFISLQDGLSYPGELKSQESAPFVLRTSSETEEAELKVDIKGNELEILVSNDPKIDITNYLWKEKISLDGKSHVISLKKTKDFQRNFFYILFYNPTNADLSYNFTVSLKSSKTIWFQGVNSEFPVDLKPYEKISVLYYFTFFYGSALQLSLSAPDFAQEQIESALKERRIIKTRYWKEEETSGSGEEVLFESLALNAAASDGNRIVVSQGIKVPSLAGKYVLEVHNPWDFTVRFTLAETKVQGMAEVPGENVQITDLLNPEDPPEFEIFMTQTPGQWYFWFYPCDREAILGISSGNEEEEDGFEHEVQQGESVVFQETIKNRSIGDRFRYVTASAPQAKEKFRFYMYSSLVNESRLWNYEAKENALGMVFHYGYERDNSELTVKFDGVEFKDPEETDRVSYQVEICSSGNELAPKEEANICDEWKGNCRKTEKELPVSFKGSIKVEFENLKNGRYLVKTKAFVKHQGQIIRFVPYTVGYVEIQSRFLSNFYVAVIWGIMAYILWKMYGGKVQQAAEKYWKKLKRSGVEGWRKLKRGRENSQIELPVVDGNKRDYDQSEGREESQVKLD